MCYNINMIVLKNTTDKIQVVLGGVITTNQLNCVANYRDITTTAYTPDRTVINTNSTTAVDIVPAPASSTQRVVDFISVFNNDTASAVVTVRFNDNGTSYTLFKSTLAPNEHLEYAEGEGFAVFSDAGSVKTSVNQGNAASSTLLNSVVLTSDVVNADAVANTMYDVTGLSFPVNAGSTYYFKFFIPYDSAATTTGSRWSINGPAFTTLFYRSNYSLAATTQTLNQGLNAYDVPAASSATSSATTGNTAMIEGFIKPSANGTVIARFASEVTVSAITAKAGALLQWQQVI